MTDSFPATPNPAGLFVETNRFLAPPGGNQNVHVVVGNLGPESAFFELSILGLPPLWISAPPPVIPLAPGERREINISIGPPAPPHGRVGRYPFTIRLGLQQNPDLKVEIECELVVGAFEVQGRIGLLLESTQYTVAPGGIVNIVAVLANNGLVEDYFSLALDGIPSGWISTASPLNRLAPGEQKEVILSIRPPRLPETTAGRKAFKLQISSRQAPGQMTEASGVLTIGAFSDFSIDLHPQRLEAKQTAAATVTNLGNTQDAYTLAWENQEDGLIFEVLAPVGLVQAGQAAVQKQFTQAQSFPLRVPAGQSGVLEFRARPANPQILGSEMAYPFTMRVQASNRSSKAIAGEVLAKGILPIWSLPVGLLICLLGVCLVLMVFLTGRGSNAIQATQAAGATQTASMTQTVSANQTKAAIEGQQDIDGDGLTDSEEAQFGTDVKNPDTDADALLDGEEVKVTGTDPKNRDTDNDRLSDGEEVKLHFTDPRNPDTDADGLIDGDEKQRGTDPRNPDSDADSLKDGDEVNTHKTDPLKPDSDDDGLNDGQEVLVGTNPTNPDSDNDKLRDGQESATCPNFLNPDTDGDGILDGRDLDPCNPSNPSLTSTSAIQTPSATSPSPTIIVPTLTPTPTLPPMPTTPAPPVLQGQIAFESNREGNPEIYVLNTSGFGVSRLTIAPGVDSQPAWDPNVNKIAFTSNRDGNNEIYVMNSDGTALVNLTMSPSDEQSPTWSPDGNWIAFTSNRDGNREIYIMKPDGSELRNLTGNPADDSQPSWYSEGGLLGSSEWIAFTTNRDGNNEIYRIKPDGTDPANLTNNLANDSNPAGQRGSGRIAFTSDRDSNQEVYSMNANGSNPVNLTRNPAIDQMPAWSPDGGWIVFVTNRDGVQELYVMKTDGTGFYNLSQNPAIDQYPAWK